MNSHPYSPAFLIDGIAYISGALSVDEDGVAVAGRGEAVSAAMARFAERLATVQLGLDDVVKTTYFVTDVTLRDEINSHYVSAFTEPRPARTVVGVAALPYGATIEVEGVAHRR